MPTVRFPDEGPFRFKILTDDHEPAHVHVYRDGKEAKVNILTGVVMETKGMKNPELSKIRALVRTHQDALLSKWREIHG